MCKSIYIRSRHSRDRFASTAVFWPYGGVERDTLQDVRLDYNVTTDIIMDVAMGAYIRPKI